MIVKQIAKNEYIIKLIVGDPVVESLKKFQSEYAVDKYSSVIGIGSINKVFVGFIKDGVYTKLTLEEEYELTNLTGSISYDGDEVFPHIHVSLSDKEMVAFGGHLFEGYCCATVEMIVKVYDIKLTRKFSNEIGIKLLDI